MYVCMYVCILYYTKMGSVSGIYVVCMWWVAYGDGYLHLLLGRSICMSNDGHHTAQLFIALPHRDAHRGVHGHHRRSWAVHTYIHTYTKVLLA